MSAYEEGEAKPELSKAVARGDLMSVSKIINAAAAISQDDKIKTMNYARKWTERHPAYKSEENPSGTAEWFDVTPITIASMRGHDAIVEYLLQQGADPTLKGCPVDDIELENEEPLSNLTELHMNAFDAASKLTRKIRCCRRTQDLLMVVKPYWRRSVYSGSSAARHKRTILNNAPVSMNWVVDALFQIPKLENYPLRCQNFDESIVDSSEYLMKRRMIEEKQIESKKEEPPQETWVETGQSRRCFSCGELKPVQSYNKNEKKKGVEARCISCVASNPEVDLSTTCSSCKTPLLGNGNGTICQPCMFRMASESKKPPAVKEESR